MQTWTIRGDYILGSGEDPITVFTDGEQTGSFERTETLAALTLRITVGGSAEAVTMLPGVGIILQRTPGLIIHGKRSVQGGVDGIKDERRFGPGGTVAACGGDGTAIAEEKDVLWGKGVDR